MISLIQTKSVTFPEQTAVNHEREVFKVLSFAINMERGIGEKISNEDEIKRQDQLFMTKVKGYASLKKYINSKLDLLKVENINSASRAFTVDKEGLMLKVSLGYGFSDFVYYLKCEKGNFFKNINSESQLYIITPISNPLAQKSRVFDTSLMYRVPAELLTTRS